MEMWKRISEQERYPVSLQPVLWMGGSKQDLPDVEVTLQIRSLQEKRFLYELIHSVNETLFIQLEVENRGIETISRVIVSHMIRDHFAYIPNTLKTDKGAGEFLFQLVRWRIDELLPNEKIQLICQVKAGKSKAPAISSLRATYTFQYKGLSYGPFQTNEVIVRQQ
ncbi:hypothetical protein D0U04_01035 [Bacillus clarus]|uniref:DUF11 domain-containing protein n=1 Tax=Bacillus clarus TaxID=2338372 RepID=A0A090YLS3_9BACI|nr:hypothetical protein [Bacillus clarus]KFM99166.1 hypothetical protein DJ93_987 [Bacillus clarus]RFT68795.1 hypothetical protein D0U04_01035 [Bacillus clarus]